MIPFSIHGGEFALSETIDSGPLTAERIRSLQEKYYNATIIERIDSHSDLSRFRIRPDTPFPSFEPGQYVTLGLGNWEPRLAGTQREVLPFSKQSKVVQRAYSISCPMLDPLGNLKSVNSVDYLEFYVTLVRKADSRDKGPPALTPRLFRQQVGDRLMVGKKIVGHYTLGPEIRPDETILLLGTGTGEAPHNAMATELLVNNHRGRIVNVTCVRHRKDLAYAQQHAQLMDTFGNYCYLAVTTRDPENLDPHHPRYVGKQYIQELFVSGRLAEMVGDPLDPKRTHVFLCGNPAMIGYVPPGAEPPTNPGMIPLLKHAGFQDAHDYHGPGSIRFEKYW
ncbi:oxidoreductase FAD/NAD(P)-binding domain protein [Rhodopirellula maiorica SM1]|uniref:ferredoxin--NADP(+) reductase n=1 Tax=Rhodopirellula maiorica SM1 TaxID=1265738 RepID=M5RHQ4_9BACT|nr:oxidoreductase FAD/NAD(P)-binding domain protein [Rhodopirellula maiorica SM1]